MDDRLPTTDLVCSQSYYIIGGGDSHQDLNTDRSATANKYCEGTRNLPHNQVLQVLLWKQTKEGTVVACMHTCASLPAAC